MRRIYAVIELEDHSLFDPTSEVDQDELAEDLLHAAHGVACGDGLHLGRGHPGGRGGASAELRREALR